MRVPVLNMPAGNIRPANAPLASTNARPYGAEALGNELSQTGQQLGEVYAKEKKRAEDFLLDKADLEAGKLANRVLYDKDTGFLNRLGEAALDNAAPLDELEKGLEEISKRLPNDELRERFSLRSGARYEQAKVATEKHTSDQRLSVYGSVADGHVKLALETASVAAEKEQVDSAVGKALVAPDGSPGPLRRYLLARGLPVEKVQAEEAAFRAEANSRALEGLLKANNRRGAEAFYSKAKGQLGAKEADYKRTLEAMAREEEADVLARQHVELATKDGVVDEAAALTAVDTSVTDTALRDETRQRVTKYASENARALNAEKQRISMEVYSTVNKVGWWDTPTEAKERLNKVNPPLYDALEDEARNEARRATAERQGRGGDTEDQRRALVQALAELKNPANHQQYAGMEEHDLFLRWGERLSGNGYKELGRAFAALKKDDPVRVSEYGRFVEGQVDGNPALKRDKKKADTYRSLMGEQRQGFIETHHREPTLEERINLDKGVWEMKDTWFGLGPAKPVLKEYEPPAAPTPTGRRKVDAQGRTWEELSDGKARLVQP